MSLLDRSHDLIIDVYLHNYVLSGSTLEELDSINSIESSYKSELF